MAYPGPSPFGIPQNSMNRPEYAIGAEPWKAANDMGRLRPEPSYIQDPHENEEFAIRGSAHGAEQKWMTGMPVFVVREPDVQANTMLGISDLQVQIALDRNTRIKEAQANIGPEDNRFEAEEPVHKRARLTAAMMESPGTVKFDTMEAIRSYIKPIGTLMAPPTPFGLFQGKGPLNRVLMATDEPILVASATIFGTMDVPNMQNRELLPGDRVFLVIKDVPASMRPDREALRGPDGHNLGRLLADSKDLIPYVYFLAAAPGSVPPAWSNPADARTPGQQPPLSDVGYWEEIVDAGGRSTGKYRQQVGLVWFFGVVKHNEDASTTKARAETCSTAGVNSAKRMMVDIRISSVTY